MNHEISRCCFFSGDPKLRPWYLGPWYLGPWYLVPWYLGTLTLAVAGWRLPGGHPAGRPCGATRNLLAADPHCPHVLARFRRARALRERVSRQVRGVSGISY